MAGPYIDILDLIGDGEFVRRAGNTLDGDGIDELAADVANNAAAQTVLDARYAAVFAVTAYGADPTGVASSSTAITNAIDAALDYLAHDALSGGVGEVSIATAVVYFPPGIYLDDVASRAVDISINVTSTGVADRPRLVLRGAGEGLSTWYYTGANGTTFTSGSLTIEGLRFVGDDTNTLLTLGQSDGAVIEAVSQLIIDGCQFHRAATLLSMPYVYDASFYDSLFRSPATVAIDMPLHDIDNNNNIHFYRCMWDAGGTGSRFIHIVGSNGARQHGKIGFHGCHMETTRRDVIAVDATYVVGLTFNGCNIIQNGSTPAVGSSTALLRFVHCVGVDFVAPVIARGTTGTYAQKMILLGGNTRAVTVTGGVISPNTGVANIGKGDCWESDPTTAFVLGSTAIDFRGVIIESYGDAEVPNEVIAVGHRTNRAARWTQRYNETTNALDFARGGIAADWTTSMTTMATLDSSGMFRANGGLIGQSQTLADDATGTFSFASVANTNRRGIYIVQANFSTAQAWVLVYSSGAALAVIATGTDATAATANPDADTKMNVYLSGTSIAVKNRLGSSREITVLPLMAG